jgi:hypothetical protein
VQQEPICKLCNEAITEGQRWEYAAGAYPVGTPEQAKQRVHGACVARQLREVIEALARVPEHKRDEITFEI